MIKFYLWLNAVLYVIFVLWCTLKHAQTARATGFIALNNSGHSEYLVIYGGLQLGLAMFYAYLASTPALHGVGVVFSLCIYAPIVIYRLSTLVFFSPVAALTLGTAALEVVLLVAASILFLRR
ncbi:MAG: DUF4345 domain-containing protein [Undibacterium sp.]|nr:DUF4345 domain-containing protein [Opitutaceae bacterium]